MRRAFAYLAVATVLTAGVLAQAKADFSGTWTQVPDAAAAQGGGRGGRGLLGLGQQATIAQDAKALTITRATQAGEFKSTYNLDGSTSTNSVIVGENSLELVSTSKWDGSQLVITTTSNFQGNTFETTMRLSLDGGTLVVETTRPDFQGGGAPITTKASYKKN
jgi:hypothetical protein